MLGRLIAGSLLAMTLAGAASAQTGNPPTTPEQRANADTQREMDKNGAHDVRNRQMSYYKSLDRNSKGYLDNDDISADPFLTQNFAKCDADHNGKLTWEEYRTCTVNNPPPATR